MFRHAPKRPLDILDVGCGAGRDLKFFRALGHRPVGVEGSPTLANIAATHSQCQVLKQDLLALSLAAEAFDVIFANASLYHVPKSALPETLRALGTALRPGGLFYNLNPAGNGDEGFAEGRYTHRPSLAAWEALLGGGFVRVHARSFPAERPVWLETLWVKKDSAPPR